MTDRLKKALDQAGSALLPEEQDRLADLILKLLDSDDEAKWDAALAGSGDELDRLASRALDDYRAGRTEPLDPDKL